jgi:hypothetical protein
MVLLQVVIVYHTVLINVSTSNVGIFHPSPLIGEVVIISLVTAEKGHYVV